MPVNSLSATPLSLWATYYHIHRAQSISNGEPLLNKQGQPLGPTLTTQDWCRSALEGTVQIADASGFQITYNFAGRGADAQVDCSAFFPKLSANVLEKVNRVRFIASAALYGHGTEGMALVPYRTIAVDRTQIPIGSVIYIPQARGRTVTLPTGDRVIHDGYFFAADVGSAIQGNHIDVFLGTSRHNPFPFITSTPNHPFQAFLVQDPQIAQALHQLHRSPTTK
ncbi:MAG: hypothetical protein HC866_12215 [Leptolyngbyaceae cyanobacterium RU_5_1]|nr:hypothetical protein [Leptolyngbyaceae cyanobacterium RU_5_1]